jgi:hypothetical protein
VRFHDLNVVGNAWGVRLHTKLSAKNLPSQNPALISGKNCSGTEVCGTRKATFLLQPVQLVVHHRTTKNNFF